MMEQDKREENKRMMFQAFLIKYGEIGIKGKNRYLFEDALIRQMKFSLQDVEGEFHIHKSHSKWKRDVERKAIRRILWRLTVIWEKQS